MDPYKVLGIPYNSTWKDVRTSYKLMLIKTHPDKMGNDQFFNMVQDAYKNIKQQFAQKEQSSNYPKYDQTYSPPPNSRQKKTKIQDNFNVKQFNEMFEQYADMYNKNDPFLSGGYRTDQRLDYQEDMHQLKSKNIHIPKRELVIYKEPEALASSSLMENVCHLGVRQIDDFTCSHGTDYMRAYSHEAELIDNRKEYKNLDAVKSARASQSFQMTSEDKRQQHEMEQNIQRLEQMRLNNVRKTDRNHSKIHSYIENRLR